VPCHYWSSETHRFKASESLVNLDALSVGMANPQMISDIQATSAPHHLNTEELAAGLAEIRRSPKEGGSVVMIVARPEPEHRHSLEQGELRPTDGLVGDRWRLTCGLKLPDGSPDPAVQITLMNARCIQLIAGEREHWPLAGDNLFLDLDLSVENLPAGARLRIGECVLEISEPPHTGCAKFKHRFGIAALQFVNSPEGKALRLRGANARVLQAGVVSVGDLVTRCERA
jgi:hypothetical protein